LEPQVSNGGRKMFLVLDRAGNLWMPDELGAVLRFKDGRSERVELPGPAARSYAICMAEDAEGGLWIGTESQGVIRLKPQTVWTVTAEDGLPHDKVWSIGEGRDGAIWLGTERGTARFREGRSASYPDPGDLSRHAVRVVRADSSVPFSG
jgi:ligand-binding sensor domain-containing protein